MLLTMGVRECPEQVEVYDEVFGVVRGKYDLYSNSVEVLNKWEESLSGEYFCGCFGLADIAVVCCTYNLFRYVMVSRWRHEFPKISCHCFLCP